MNHPRLAALAPVRTTTGSFAIQALGDGRAMSFNLPAIAQRLGYRNAANSTRSTVHQNLPAANAVLGTLGIAAIAP